MANRFLNMIIAAALILLFMYCAIKVTIDWSNVYDKDVTDLEGEKLGWADVQSNISEMKDKSDAWEETFFNFDWKTIVTGEFFVGLVSLFTTMWTTIKTSFTLIFQTLTSVLGIPAIVINILLFIIVIAVLFAVISVVKKGD